MASSPSLANPVLQSKSLAKGLLEKCKKVASGKSITEAGITADWLQDYAKIAERADHEQRFGVTRYAFQAGDAASAFIGGFFDNEDWLLRQKLAKQQSIHSVAEHEAKYINASGYWSIVRHVPYELRQEVFES